MTITRDDIVAGLRSLGLSAGDCVLTHSSLSSFGHVEGGADAVIDAIIEAVSPICAAPRRTIALEYPIETHSAKRTGGTVLFPTLTGSAELSRENPPVFDVLHTPCWTGRIPETARTRQGFVRSSHPTHSVCALGEKAGWFTEGHECSPTPCGIGSPYDKLVQSRGYILLIGVTHNSNTTMHYIEEIAGVPWHMQAGTALSTIKFADGRMARIPVTLHKYGTPRDFTRLESEMLAKRIQVNGRIGESTIRLVKAREMVDLVLERAKEDPEILLPAGVG